MMDQGFKILIAGIGSAGNNVINEMFTGEPYKSQTVAVHTSREVLDHCKASKHILVGEHITNGLGVGVSPALGEKAARESEEAILEALRDVDILFLICGLGAGTGTGVTPVMAKLAKTMGILTICFAIVPFRFEAKERKQNALQGIEPLKKAVDTLVIFPNNALLEMVDRHTSLAQALQITSSMIGRAVRGIAGWAKKTTQEQGNLTEVRRFFQEKGIAYMGAGSADGKDRAADALQQAISSPLLEADIDQISQAMLYITGCVSDEDHSSIDSYLQEVVRDISVNVVVEKDEQVGNEVEVTVLAFSDVWRDLIN